jgi:hypothetical protein
MGSTFGGGLLPTNFWSRFVQSSAQLSALGGLAGVLLAALLAGAVAAWRIRADVTV